MAKNISELLITKRFINMVNKFNEELKAFAKETEEEEPTLYEDIFLSFTLSNVRIEGDYFCYNYDGVEERELIWWFEDGVTDEWKAYDEGDYYCNVEEIKESIKFWKSCLRRAKRYWGTSGDKLDKIGEDYLNGKEEIEE